jgi:hypothetical protein
MHATNWIATGLLGLGLGACVQENDDLEVMKRSLPTAAQVAIEVPEQASGALRSLGQIADYYVLTRAVSRDLNGAAAWALIVVHAIVQYPPTSHDAGTDTYVWGPHSDALDPAEWRLTVTARPDGSYDWALDGRSRSDAGSAFETVIDGNAIPGADDRGSGNYFFDFDASERVNPIDNDARGSLAVAYDLENRDGSDATLLLAVDSYEPDSDGVDQPVHYDYGYAAALDGSGELAFAIHGDTDDDGSLIEDVAIHSRWQADGAGRGDARLQGGDLGGLIVTASECWDTSFRRVYYIDSASWAPSEGEPASCAFPTAELPSE